MFHLCQYIPGRSIIHDLDPRVKIASVIGLSVIILQGHLFTAIMMSGFFVILFPVAHLAPRHTVQAIRPMVIFLGLLFFMHLNFTEGTPIPPFPQWYITPTYEGLYRGMRITWDFVLLLISAAVLTRTTSPTEIVRGIEGLLRPLGLLGIPSHDIAIMIAIALRFVPVFLEEIERIKEAQMARGAEFKTGTLLQRTKAAIGMLTPLIVGFARRADELAIAMEARGYSRGRSRTYMTELRISWADYGAIGIMILITGAHIFVRHIFGT